MKLYTLDDFNKTYYNFRELPRRRKFAIISDNITIQGANPTNSITLFGIFSFLLFKK